jgi:hypothetical protein
MTFAHVDAALDRRRAHVRQGHAVARQQLRVDCGPFSNTSRPAPAIWPAHHARVSFSSITSPRAVLTM